MDPDLKTAVERLHDFKTSFIEDIVVVEKFEDKTAWSGTVSAFKIEGHPKTTRAYAWSAPIEGSTKRRNYAVLHIPPVDSPQKAVRVSIAQDKKAGRL